MDKTSKFGRLLRAFWRAKAANVAMMFGLSLVPLAIATGVGLDYAHALMVRQSMSDALDAAALAVGASPNTDPATAQALAQKVFDANYHADTAVDAKTGAAMNPQVGTPTIANGHVTLSVNFSVQTTLLGVIGKPTLPVAANSTVMWAQTKLWVALVLDNTGSMCEPDSAPCTTDTSPDIKINALKAASHSLLGILKNAAVNPGDMKVSIVPFTKDVNMGTSNVNASWIDWTDWNTQYGSAPSSSYGPGSNCPLGLGCVDAPGSTTKVSKVPASGMICPGPIGSSSSGQTGHYYDGCYTSVQQKKVTTTTTATPMTDKQNCQSVNQGATTCTDKNGYPSSGNASSSNVVTYAANYTGDSTSSTAPATSNSSTNDGSSSCSNNSSNCKTGTKTWTRTITYTSTVVTTAVTASGRYDHSWAINDHSLWSGCVMDRDQNDDATNTTPGTKFPAENDDSCPASPVTTLSYQWDDLNAQVDAMQASGGTNQTIGLAHGMQTLVTGAPYSAPTLPDNTKRYIILLSDGLNTMDRWYGNGSAQSSSVDNRMKAACTNAKAQGFIIYTVFVDLKGGIGSSSVLQNCATDSSKYFDLTSSGAIVTAFNQIALEITNLRVSS